MFLKLRLHIKQIIQNQLTKEKVLIYFIKKVKKNKSKYNDESFCLDTITLNFYNMRHFYSRDYFRSTKD